MQNLGIQFRCGECGSPNVQVKAWARINTNTVSDYLDSREYWCEDEQVFRWTAAMINGASVWYEDPVNMEDLYAHVFDDFGN